MKAHFLSFILIFLGHLCLAQTSWQNAHQTPFFPNAVAVDATGHSYVLSSFSGSLALGATTLVSQGQSDLVLAKYTSTGALLWATNIGGAGANAYGKGLAVDAQGNCYLTGGFSGTLNYHTGGATLTTLYPGHTGTFDQIIVAKCAPNGTVLWARQGGSADYASWGNAVAIDAVGNCFVTGRLSGSTVVFGHLTLRGPGSRQIFAAAYDANGTVQWVLPMSSFLNNAGTGIAADGIGNCYVTGSFHGQLILSTTGAMLLQAPPGNAIFLLKIKAKHGKLQWAQQASSSLGEAEPAGLTADRHGNCYLTGTFRGTASFGSVTTTDSPNLRAFLAHYTSNGRPQWARAIGTDSRGMAVVSNTTGIYALVNHEAPSSYLSIAAFDDEGTLEREYTNGGTGSAFGTSLGVGAQRNLAVAGIFSGSVAFGSHALAGPANSNFVARLNANVASKTLPITGSASPETLQLYPNPAKDNLTLIIPTGWRQDAVQAALYNRFGQTVLQHTVSSPDANPTLRLDLGQLPSGLYTLRLTGSGKTLSQQVAVE
ncbi:SBBP repeat-containing protein [Hymenobacter koreensis]|uniref:Secretion system C-terminal sorting domain-containing protein n=1 Tax=Hymenobacter koreensis TaxID=1084523 RepID=A0ABP8IZS2_9BACT